MSTCAHPKAVAYLRIHPEDADGLIAMQEKLFVEYAEKRGFDLCHIEFEPKGSINVRRIGEVIEEHHAQHFLVLSMENVTTHPAIASSLDQAITFCSGAEIHEIGRGSPRSR
ncbi:hypothetical protein ACWEHT_22355 [Streptomyces sp. NPDC004646]